VFGAGGAPKLDVERAVQNGARLPNELIHPGLARGPVALSVHVDAVSDTWRRAINSDPEPDRAAFRRSHDEIEIAGVKAVCDPPAGSVERVRQIA
jgi:hypothetical protein